MWCIERKPKLAVNELVSLCPAELVSDCSRQVVGEVLETIHDRSWMKICNPPPRPKDVSEFAPAPIDERYQSPPTSASAFHHGVGAAGAGAGRTTTTDSTRMIFKTSGENFAQSSLNQIIEHRERAKQAMVYRIGFPPSFDYVIETTGKTALPKARVPPKSPIGLLKTPVKLKKCGSTSRLRRKKQDAVGSLIGDSCTSPAMDWLVSIQSQERDTTMACAITPLSTESTPVSMDDYATPVKGLLAVGSDGGWTRPLLEHAPSDVTRKTSQMKTKPKPKQKRQTKTKDETEDEKDKDKPQSTKSHACSSSAFSISFTPSFMSPLSSVRVDDPAAVMTDAVTIDMTGKLGITVSTARLLNTPPAITNLSYSLLPMASEAPVNTSELRTLRTNFKEFFHGELWLSSSQVSCVTGYDINMSVEHVTAERKLSQWLNDYCEKHKHHIHWAIDDVNQCINSMNSYRMNNNYNISNNNSNIDCRPFNINGVIDFEQFMDILFDLLPLQRYFEFEQTNLETVVLVDRDSFGRLCSGTFEDVTVSADTFFSPHELSHVYSVIYSDEIPEEMEDPCYLPLYAIAAPNNSGKFINISEMFCDWTAEDFQAYFDARGDGVEFNSNDTLECLLCELALDTLFAFAEDLGLHKSMPMKKYKSVGFDDCYYLIYAWISQCKVKQTSSNIRKLFPIKLIDLCYDFI